MGNKKHIFTALVLMLIAISCSEGIEINTSEYEFVGDWNWISTDGGLVFNIHETPQTADKSIQLKLTDDSKYSVLENNVVVASGTYEIMPENSIYSQNM
ncbi:MAG TPA: hypothetical protein VKA10_01525 [Prolixibacteraceae bacterium]|nr:hypothetical protein [Prolixibacteraceae bacterium]